MKLIKKNNKKGFTLIELVIVIAILAILALILVPTIGNYTGKANAAKVEASTRSLYTEAVLLNTEKEYAGNKTEIENKLIPATDPATTDPKVNVEISEGVVKSVEYTSGIYSFKFDGKTMKQISPVK